MNVSTLVVEWIEICIKEDSEKLARVSTLVVEWIEIHEWRIYNMAGMSPPSWWSGLKL